MQTASMNIVPMSGSWMSVQPQPDRERQKRIFKALGLTGSQNPRVNEESLILYYDYLARHLEFPFVACYPPPATPGLAAIDRCEVLELLDPRDDFCDEFDGLYCRTRKGRFLVNLPLVELNLLPSSKNLELLDDYEYWFWHWRD